MSYHRQATGINEKLKKAFKDIENKETIKDIVNAMLYFGQVAKFRCRANVAYDNFSAACLRDIAELGRLPLPGQDFDVLQVVKVEDEIL